MTNEDLEEILGKDFGLAWPFISATTRNIERKREFHAIAKRERRSFEPRRRKSKSPREEEAF